MTAKTKRKLLNNVSCYLMGGLPVVGFLLFGLLPLLISAYLSFTQLLSYDFRQAVPIGFDNYVAIFRDPMFYKAIGNTVIALIAVPLQMVIGLLIAGILTNKSVKGKKIFRSLFFIPFVCSSVAVTLTFKWMFDSEFGIINALLVAMGGHKVQWLTSKVWFMPIMILMMSWTKIGYYIILFQAALTNMNQSTLEAAEIDGAGAFRKFVSITVPAISPTTFYLLVMGIIGGLQEFAWFQIMCDGMINAGFLYGPNDNGLTVVYYLYNQGFIFTTTEGMGRASATAWVLAIGIMLLTALNFKLSKRWVHYDD